MKGGKAHQGLPGFVNFDQPPATELPTVQKPTFVFFDALTAHEIRQDAVQLTPAQLCGEQPVPKEFTRSAEFPMFVSELLHGTPHQSREEVAAAYAIGTPPTHWAHVYTGNPQGASAARHLEPLVAPVQVSLTTLLAKCLLQGTDAEGCHAFATFPQAVSWLLTAAASGGGLDAIKEAELVQARATLVPPSATPTISHHLAMSHHSAISYHPCRVTHTLPFHTTLPHYISYILPQSDQLATSASPSPPPSPPPPSCRWPCIARSSARQLPH